MSRCTDCENIDISSIVPTNRGNGKCHKCKGTGRDEGAEALVQFGTLGIEGKYIPCKICSGTGQCQTCGGTGKIKENDPGWNGPREDSPPVDGNAILGKIIGVLILTVIIIWLIFAVVIPLLFIDIALIALVVSLAKKSWNNFLYPISFLGSIYVILDYNNGWFTKSFATNVSFLSGLIPILYYINIIAGLVAAYFFIRNLLNKKSPHNESESEFSKRNLIIMGALLLFGVLTVGLPEYFGSRSTNEFHSNEILTNQNNDATINNSNNNSSNNSSNVITTTSNNPPNNAPSVDTNRNLETENGTSTTNTSSENQKKDKPSSNSENNNIKQSEQNSKFEKDKNEKTYTGKYDKYGKRTGPGELTTIDGNYYVGVFSNGTLIKGNVKIKYNGGTYKGDYSNNSPNGNGAYIDKDGNKYEGNFVNGAIKGSANVKYNNGGSYKGELSNNLPNGNGTYIDQNGKMYVGIFKNGNLYNGTASTLINGKKINYSYENGISHEIKK